MNQNDNEMKRFEKIIGLPHPVSKTHKPMSAWSRAAQFSPFAALTGYEDAVEETARRTSERVELDEEAKEKLNARLLIVQQLLDRRPEIAITYFVPDTKKSGGEYVTHTSPVKKIDLYQRVVVLTDGTRIPIDEIIEIEGEIFHNLDDDYA